ncbi:SGNH/GDSL hydrolase family protein [Nocardioides sp.]|uniref:SGNH/GDSL hydrolase family protein n=1 Tax=Nocardioides sp. TaxID=35761 RepID=UPI00351575EB
MAKSPDRNIRRASPSRTRQHLRHGLVVGLVVLVGLGVAIAAAVLLQRQLTSDEGASGDRFVVADLPDALALPEAPRYVALGDSFSAGLGIAPAAAEQPGCGRSTNNYPNLLARRIQAATLVDATCAGASTAAYYDVQATSDPLGPPPQRDAITRDTDLVTVALGGNDDDIFGTLIDRCPKVASLDPEGSPCVDSLDVDLLARAEEVRGRVLDVLRDIRQRAPDAVILYVGYPMIFEGDTCAAMGFAAGDAAYASKVFARIDEVQREAAAKADVPFINLRSATVGRGICGEDPLVAGFEPTAFSAAAWHAGSEMAGFVADTLASVLTVG